MSNENDVSRLVLVATELVSQHTPIQTTLDHIRYLQSVSRWRVRLRSVVNGRTYPNEFMIDDWWVPHVISDAEARQMASQQMNLFDPDKSTAYSLPESILERQQQSQHEFDEKAKQVARYIWDNWREYARKHDMDLGGSA